MRADEPDLGVEAGGRRIERDSLKAAQWTPVQQGLAGYRLAQAKEAARDAGPAKQGRQREFEIDAAARERFTTRADQGRATIGRCGRQGGGDEAAIRLAPQRQEVVVEELAAEEAFDRVADAAEAIVALSNVVKDKKATDEIWIILGRGAAGCDAVIGQAAPCVQQRLGVRVCVHVFHRQFR